MAVFALVVFVGMGLGLGRLCAGLLLLPFGAIEKVGEGRSV